MSNKQLHDSINLLRQISEELRGRSEISLVRNIDEVISELEKLAKQNPQECRSEVISSVLSKGIFLASLAKALISLIGDSR